MVDRHLKPGVIRGYYPQQQDTWPSALEMQVRQSVSKAKHWLRRHKYTLSYITEKVNRYEEDITSLSDKALQQKARELKKNLQRHGFQEHLVCQSFATIREAAHRVLGKRHFDVQLLGGWVMINGMVAEMETGEGKTLTATLASCTAALAGIPVHVLTANDYLASRDERLLKPLYKWLGITSAAVIDGMENDFRVQAYRSDIVHSTGQQIAFDYLRDRLEMGHEISKLELQFKRIQSVQQQKSMPFLLRGLCFALVDEADSLLIDEAKTPLILSQSLQSEGQDQHYFDALYLATSLNDVGDFNVDLQNQQIILTPAGKDKLTKFAAPLGEFWHRRKQREIMTVMALKAMHLFRRDEHYLVRDNKVVIIDSLTGRVMPDRSWEYGLHQLIEAKEACEITEERNPLARISYQIFFKRYLHLAGMSGTVTEVASELNNVYGLHVVKIPTHRPSCRIIGQEQVYKNASQKWQAFIGKIVTLHQQGRPILIGTKTVADSEKVSALLSAHRLPHQVLNAHQDQQEAEIIATAGEFNNITVATNMAGRGTDIALGDGVKNLGGLHVISTEKNDSKRVDRQLYGRCARQGDPGSTEAFLSLEDDIVVKFYPIPMLKLLAGFCSENKPLPSCLGKVTMARAQNSIESKNYRMRQLLIKQDKQQANLLAFSGRGE